MSEIEYLPYKAINVFIEREYLDQVLETVLDGKEDLPKEDQISFTKNFKQYITVLGFRNILKAPKRLQVNAFATAFESKNEVIPFTLSTWAKIKAQLASDVKAWLEAEGWENIAVERTFNETEGFLHTWPKDLTFEKIEKDFAKKNPKSEFDRNDLILMVIWLSGKLPSEQSVI